MIKDSRIICKYTFYKRNVIFIGYRLTVWEFPSPESLPVDHN